MNLDSFVCELCILQKRETVNHLFFRCNFAKACWQQIGVTYVSTRSYWNIIEQIKHKLEVPFYMEIIILIIWSIWTTRNNWLFNDLDPFTMNCKQKFLDEFSALLLRARPSLVQQMEVWMHSF
uniref:Reverse transcriptase zinc-binding domain-containing protein n=1 Tax=Setaria viridis TaxID=4556 RepID=A0A4U6U6Y3_SETVI|nr:hypothetical protein SEVIR_6G136800v2 [Setaria viridis]